MSSINLLITELDTVVAIMGIDDAEAGDHLNLLIDRMRDDGNVGLVGELESISEILERDGSEAAELLGLLADELRDTKPAVRRARVAARR